MNSQPVVWEFVQPWLPTHPAQGRCRVRALLCVCESEVLAHLDLTSAHLNLESRLLHLCLILRGLLLRRLEGALGLPPLFSPRGSPGRGLPAFGPASDSHGMSPLAGPGDAAQAEHHQAGCRFPVSSVPLGDDALTAILGWSLKAAAASTARESVPVKGGPLRGSASPRSAWVVWFGAPSRGPSRRCRPCSGTLDLFPPAEFCLHSITCWCVVPGAYKDSCSHQISPRALLHD